MFRWALATCRAHPRERRELSPPVRLVPGPVRRAPRARRDEPGRNVWSRPVAECFTRSRG